MVYQDRNLFAYEDMVRLKGYRNLAGVDEAGRGPLAGPVVAAACIIPEGLIIDGVDDSKSIAPLQRARVFQRLTTHPDIQYAVGCIEAQDIDEINILQATFKAMQRAVEGLPSVPDFILVDGSLLPAWNYPSIAVIKGDALSHSIAAASIIAKETRDRLMETYELQYPGYGFKQHKGYGTKKHLEAINELGPCQIHRKTFEPVKSLLQLDMSSSF
jgi:ribonuclease HII